ncbi:MAG: hypothetical protein M0Z59_06675 [Nitrospiraceae bacterium]|nr:hypothetical protein [Nitrospiraceae bacterium]
MSGKKAYIKSFAAASPSFCVSQKEAGEFLMERYAGRLSTRGARILKVLFAHPSIKRRAFALDRPDELVEEDADRRIARFTRESIKLSAQALRAALEGAGISPYELRGIIVNTCTGYICPGVSTYLIERLGLRRDIKAFDLVGAGCGGAMPNLEMAGLLARNGPVASISVEICTATFQMADELTLLLSNTLFADGAAAAIVAEDAGGLEIMGSAAYFAPEQRESIRYVHRGGQLFNQLHDDLPELVKDASAKVACGLLTRMGLDKQDIKHWAVHAGGEKIINAVREGVGLSPEQAAPARRVLEGYGNMSSPTVWFVLREIMERGIGSGEFCMLLSFGAGLSAHACLLRKT